MVIFRGSRTFETWAEMLMMPVSKFHVCGLEPGDFAGGTLGRIPANRHSAK
jgi:hypothetical protein